MLKLINRCKKMGKGLIILDIQELDVSTHSLLPTGNALDFNNYKSELEYSLRNRKSKKTTSQRFPCLATHCIKWARHQFTNFFGKIHDELRDFMQDFPTYFEKLRWEFKEMESSQTLAFEP